MIVVLDVLLVLVDAEVGVAMLGTSDVVPDPPLLLVVE